MTIMSYAACMKYDVMAAQSRAARQRDTQLFAIYVCSTIILQ